MSPISSYGSITPTNVTPIVANNPNITPYEVDITRSISPKIKSPVMDNSNLPIENPFEN